MPDDGFEARSKAFVHEFLSQPGAYLHSWLQVADLRSRGRGRGVLATKPIAADTELFRVPRTYTINVAASELFQTHAHIFEELAADADDGEDDVLPISWLRLIIVLVHDYSHLPRSRWKAYWDILPTEFDTLMFWNDQELDQLQASAVRKHIGKEEADNLFLHRMIPLIRKHASVFFPSPSSHVSDEKLLEICHRMGSLIMAYAFDMQSHPADSDSESGEDGWVEDRNAEITMGMVPFADTLNADAEFNAHVEHETDQLVIRSLRPIDAGEEVINYYGPLPNCDLARRYGYTSKLHARYDVVELPWDLVLATAKTQFGEATGKDVDEDEVLEDTFVLERDSGEPDEMGVNNTKAQFTDFPDELVSQTTAILAPEMKIDLDQRRPDSRQTKALKLGFLRVVNQTIRLRIEQYGTGIEEDEGLLLDDNLPTRLKMAIDIRLGEKSVLLEAEVRVAELLQKYEGKEVQGRGNDSSDRSSAKKARKAIE